MKIPYLESVKKEQENEMFKKVNIWSGKLKFNLISLFFFLSVFVYFLCISNLGAWCIIPALATLSFSILSLRSFNYLSMYKNTARFYESIHSEIENSIK